MSKAVLDYIKAEMVTFLRNNVWITGVFCLFLLLHSAVSTTCFQDGRLRYTREDLFALRDTLTLITHLKLPSEMQKNGNDFKNTTKRKRGKRGGIRQRLRKGQFKVSLPSLVLANVRSMRTSAKNFKLDEVRTNIKYQEEFRNAGLLIFTETWWDGDTPKDCINLNGHGFSKPFRTVET